MDNQNQVESRENFSHKKGVESEVVKQDNSKGMTQSQNKNSKSKVSALSIFLSQLAAVENLREILDPKKVYIAKVPKEYMESSDNYFMKDSKTHELISTIMEKREVGPDVMVHQLRVEEMNVNVLQNFQNATTSLANVATQQQMDNVLKVLVDVKSSLKELKSQRQEEYIREVNGLEKTLKQAMLLDESDSLREKLLGDSIIFLNSVIAQIEGIIHEEINRNTVPKSLIKSLIKAIRVENYTFENLERSKKIVDKMFSAYIRAQQLLVLVYDCLGKSQVNEEVIRDISSTLKEWAANYRELVSAVNPKELRETENNRWYEDSAGFLESLKKETIFELVNKETIPIEFTVEQLIAAEVDLNDEQFRERKKVTIISKNGNEDWERDA